MSDRIKKYRYSEIFGGNGYTDENGTFHPGSIQGEGEFTGVPTVWIRLWGCNKECSGFGQHNPTAPETYELPYQDIDVSKYKTLEELPVFEKGCDSSYSWSVKFMNLAHKDTTEDIVNKIRQRLVDGKFRHPKTHQPCHMAFTGGEPILSQHAVVAIMEEFAKQNEVPEYVTIETNGSLELKQDFIDVFKKLYPQQDYSPMQNLWYSAHGKNMIVRELFWSVSPKIFSTSGETFESSIVPGVVKQYYDLSPKGQLKFVCNGSKQSWDEIDQAVKLYQKAGVYWPVWIMPVGATIEGQNLVASDVADQAILRGYYVSARVHTYLWHNAIGR